MKQKTKIFIYNITKTQNISGNFTKIFVNERNIGIIYDHIRQENASPKF